MPRRFVSSLAASLALLAGVPAAHAADDFKPARGEERRALVLIAKREHLRGGFAYLTIRAGGTRFGVACGRSGGTYGGMVPVRRTGGTWRAYDPVSGALQTYAAACDRRR